MTYSEALKKGIRLLEEAEVPNAHFDGEELLLFAVQKERGWLLANKIEPMAKSDEERYFSCIDRRCQRIPLQHILGRQDFMGLSFFVNESVLCPRIDTESLVEQVQKQLDELFVEEPIHKRKLLDLCTGSGCIAISCFVYAKKKGYPLSVYATDISSDALAVAKKNCKLNHAEATLREGDLFTPVEGETFDLIVSNPPYIPRDVIGTLMPEVRIHEPFSALCGGDDGLDFYKRITGEASKYLNPGGRLLCEIGFLQGKDVSEMFKASGLCDVKVHKDLANNDRIVSGHL